MDPLALELVCNFMQSGPWTSKELKDLAAVEATCKEARASLKPSRVRKPVAQARKALMEDLADWWEAKHEEYMDYQVNDARDSARDKGQIVWQHPFSKHWLPVDPRLLGW